MSETLNVNGQATETSVGRRQILRSGLAAIALAPITPIVGHSVQATTASATGTGKIAAAAQARPIATAMQRSFAGAREHYGPTQVPVRGQWPEQLQGTLYRNGPARFHRGQTRYQHWFDGDGMVHAFQFSGGQITHTARMVATERAALESAAGRFLWNGFGTRFEDARSAASPDAVNVANISVLPVGDELLALWEAGSAYRIDPNSLETLGRKVWSAPSNRAPFGAHPRVESDGRIWNFGYLPGSGKLLLYDISPSGKLQRMAIVETPNADMVHDFAITERYLVFLLTPLAFSAGPGAFADRLRWQPDQPNRIVLIDKQSLEVSQHAETRAGFFFHLGNAWDDGQGVRLQVMNAPAFDSLMGAVRQATLGRPAPALAPPAASELLINRNGSVSEQDLPMTGSEFPSFDPRFTGRATRLLVSIARSENLSGPAIGFDTVQAFDRTRGQLSQYRYQDQSIAEEHLFVARPGGNESDGWIIGTRYDSVNEMTRVAVFDAAHLVDGPLAEAALPYGLPLGLHGRFVTGAIDHRQT